MIKTRLIHGRSLQMRILCLVMAGLTTACSTARPRYVWQDVSPTGTAAVRHATHASASQAPETWGSASDEANGADPVIAPGFLLVLTSVADRQLNGEYRVNFDGTLQLPYGVTASAGGYTLSQLKKRLDAQYQPYFKTPTDIELKVKERSYYVDVRGLVQKPGQYLVDRSASLDQVINMAGGIDKQTVPQFVRIQKGAKVFVLDLNQYYGQGEDHPLILGWLGGELIFLQKEISSSLMEKLPSSTANLPIYMLGEVQKPGEYPVKPGSDFVDALIQAGGFTSMADEDHIEIIRRAGGRERVFEFAWREFQRAPVPMPGDVIIVHADRQIGLERKIQIAALLASILSSAAVIYEIDKNR